MTLFSKLPIGADAYDVVADLIRNNPAIQEIELFRPRLAPLLSERAHLTGSEQKIVNSAIVLKEQTGLPFWDAVMVNAAAETGPVEGLLAAGAFHNPQIGHQPIGAQQATAETLRRLGNDVVAGSILAISSKVRCIAGRQLHIPQIDFHCRASASNQRLALALLRTMSQRGYLLSSGKSYHFYGIDLLNAQELRIFLGRVLLFSPIVDRAWIAHQLIEGQCALRLSGRQEYGSAPRLVAITHS